MDKGLAATAKEIAYEKHAKRIFGTRPRSLDSITHFYAGWNAAEARCLELERVLREVRRALDPEDDPTRLPYKALCTEVQKVLASSVR
jgi:hypothetical protein